MTAICLEDPADVGFLRADVSRAVSPQAADLAKKFEEVERRFLETWAGRVYHITRERIRVALAEAADSNWDGYGSRAANRMAVEHAMRFLWHIPAGLPEPGVGIDPDGEISLEWYKSPYRRFSVSVGRDGRLSFAGLFGRSSIHGTEAYFVDELPVEIRSGLRRIFH